MDRFQRAAQKIEKDWGVKVDAFTSSHNGKGFVRYAVEDGELQTLEAARKKAKKLFRDTMEDITGR